MSRYEYYALIDRWAIWGTERDIKQLGQGHPAKGRALDMNKAIWLRSLHTHLCEYNVEVGRWGRARRQLPSPQCPRGQCGIPGPVPACPQHPVPREPVITACSSSAFCSPWTLLQLKNHSGNSSLTLVNYVSPNCYINKGCVFLEHH